ncbi:MAG: hypothetical protein KDD50_01185 [Bdellovibrionales bacterium]|nr:hypothetical protein [Bdellovibrionales bacterium]
MGIKKVISIGLVMMGMAGCNSEVIPIESSNSEDSYEVLLVKKTQRVVRYDCDEKLISDRVETVKSPQKFMRISPRTYSGIFGSQFKNLTTGDTGMSYNYDSFYINTSPTWLDIHVIEGKNELRYEFTFCSDIKEDSEQNQFCAGEKSYEVGTRYIDVKYEEQHIEEVKVVKPIEGSCSSSTLE